ncbi:hypothetical protein LO762_29780 [Actinocorallia sp. API 0066]|uniref:hypothetical protein n=1 Tax=Actinocorallia sp. API 0066 TaxID=2896846 RepID=UPI001E2AD270|nr:hypothetical protein [Actinocorallia sp. API 0066]MCD0453340.1 hypothetical protein [Actinocorallia sp. API 0066]
MLAIIACCAVGWSYYSGFFVIAILLAGYYQLCQVPTLCGVETTRGTPCRHRAYGRLMACTREPSHDVYKRDIFLSILGIRRPPRAITAPTRGARPGRTATAAPPLTESMTIESKQLFIAVITIIFTVIGTIATIVQTVLAAGSP